ncbi:MAG TPA: hypothetical protein VNV42_10410 [Solirubrobacteraceae bacterium]|jgi:hypothetical protein|nr:hypothetical protein [Solirubrobacteraceae bacterium]
MPIANRRTWPVPVRVLLSLAAACLAVALAVPVAQAGTPASVTVRVVGLTGTTLLAQTQVTTNGTPIDPDSNPLHTCSGTSAGGALYDAVRGNWVVKYDEGLGYEIDGIQGLNFAPFSESSPPDAYWSFWLNGAPATEGACEQELAPGSDVVFFAQCVSTGVDCPTNGLEPEHFLTTTAPSTAQVGVPVTVKVGSLNTATGSAESSVPGVVTVSAGSIGTSADAEGVAMLTFPSTGTYTIQASAPDSVPADPLTICVHNGNDGTCGTTVTEVACPASSSGCGPVKTIFSPAPLPEAARAGGAINGRVYSKRTAPRILGGSVEVPAGDTLHEVRIALERRIHGRCYAFSGIRGAFVRGGCHKPRFFEVGDTESFTYLLPARLPRGSYVYDVEAVNDVGGITALTKGLSSVAFSVK